MSTAKTLSIETMKKIAEERGGWCLSDNYINQLTKLTWKCSEGHIWETTPKTIRKGSGAHSAQDSGKIEKGSLV